MLRPTPFQPATTAVLVADDDADMREAIHGLLASEGYDVIETTDGDTTLELLIDTVEHGDALPDVLVLDFVMPGFSAIGVLRELRRIAKVPPTVVITGFPDRSFTALARTFGVQRVLYKPFEGEELLVAVFEAARQAAGENA
jgi:DNA-binding response OmpR family regulator